MKLLAVVPLRSGGWIRWTARILALLIAVFVSAMVIGGAIMEPPSWSSPDLWIGIGVVVMSAWVVVSMLASWRWEKLGGLSLVLAGVAFSIIVFVRSDVNNLLPALTVGVPVVLIGVAFLYANRAEANASREGGS